MQGEYLLHEHCFTDFADLGVFLHVLADTLGSVFVIISTILIQLFGWQWVDPLCSLILSVLILGSVIPLLKSSASTLLQSVPEEMSEEMECSLEEVASYNRIESTLPRGFRFCTWKECSRTRSSTYGS